MKKYYGCHDYAADTILYVRQDSVKCSNAVELYFTWLWYGAVHTCSHSLLKLVIRNELVVKADYVTQNVQTLVKSTLHNHIGSGAR